MNVPETLTTETQRRQRETQTGNRFSDPSASPKVRAVLLEPGRKVTREITRREILRWALMSPMFAAAPILARSQQRLTLQSFKQAPAHVVPLDDGVRAAQVKLIRTWKGALCQSRLINRGSRPVRLKEVVLFDLSLTLAPQTRLYGEGFQMLSQTGGTLGQPEDLGNYTDAKHYKLPAPAGTKACYGLMTLAPPEGDYHLLGFTSCRRFMGQFYLHDSALRVVIDIEGLN